MFATKVVKPSAVNNQWKCSVIGFRFFDPPDQNQMIAGFVLRNERALEHRNRLTQKRTVFASVMFETQPFECVRRGKTSA